MRSGTSARTWCPFAKRYPGPAKKLGYSDFKYSPKRGATLHDSTGPLAPTLNTLMGERIASWTFTIDDSNGDLYEHYDVEGNTWHGNDTDSDDAVEANYDLVGIEFTRPNAKIASPLSEASIQTAVKLLRWLGEVCGLEEFVRFPDQIGAFTLSDHNQVANSPTACPSGRIPFAEILYRLGGDEMFIPWAGFVELSLSTGDIYHNLRDNLALPVESNDWQLQILTDFGGQIDVYHGKDRTKRAGQARYSDSMRVQLDDKGGIWFSGAKDTAKVGVLAVGYYT